MAHQYLVRVEAEDTATTVFGTLSWEEGRYRISYEETRGDLAGCSTTVTCTENRLITVDRTGPVPLELSIEPGKRHECRYETEYGTLFLGVTGMRVDSDMNPSGGSLSFTYQLDQNGDPVSDNTLHITVKENF